MLKPNKMIIYTEVSMHQILRNYLHLNEAGQRLIVLQRECTGHIKHSLPTTQERTLHMDVTRWSTGIRLTIFFAGKSREAVYSQQKQDQDLTVAQIINSLLPNSGLN